MRRQLTIGFLLFWLHLPAVWSAVQISGLYQAQVVIPNQEQQSVDTGFQQAINRVLIKLTGAADTIYSTDTQSTIGRADRYVQTYQFLPSPLGEGWFLSVQFDPLAMSDLIAALGLTQWSDTRPAALTWIWLTLDGVPWVITPDDRANEAEQVRVQSDALGVPVLFPLMDLEDRRSLNAGSLQQVTEAGAQMLMERYAVQALLLGDVTAENVFVNPKTGQMMTEEEATAAVTQATMPTPVATPEQPTSGLAQAAQMRDPAMANMNSGSDIVHKPTKPKETIQPIKKNQWFTTWRLYTQNAGLQMHEWQGPNKASFSEAVAAGFAQTAQHLAALSPATKVTTTIPDTSNINTTTAPVIEAAPVPVDANAPVQEVMLVVSGINNLSDYTTVRAYLSNLALVRAVDVHSMTQGEVTYRLTVTGDENALQTAIGSGATLSGVNILPGVNLYRYNRP